MENLLKEYFLKGIELEMTIESGESDEVITKLEKEFDELYIKYYNKIIRIASEHEINIKALLPKSSNDIATFEFLESFLSVQHNIVHYDRVKHLYKNTPTQEKKIEYIFYKEIMENYKDKKIIKGDK